MTLSELYLESLQEQKHLLCSLSRVREENDTLRSHCRHSKKSITELTEFNALLKEELSKYVGLEKVEFLTRNFYFPNRKKIKTHLEEEQEEKRLDSWAKQEIEDKKRVLEALEQEAN